MRNRIFSHQKSSHITLSVDVLIYIARVHTVIVLGQLIPNNMFRPIISFHKGNERFQHLIVILHILSAISIHELHYDSVTGVGLKLT